MQARWGTHGDHTIIALTPATVQECYELTVEAFNLAERFSTPVILLTDASLGHLREKITRTESSRLNVLPRTKPDMPPEQYRPYRTDNRKVPQLSAYGEEHILRVTSLVHDEKGYSSGSAEVSLALAERLEAKIIDFQEELPPAKYYGQEHPQTVVISYGTSARAARAAVDALNAGGKHAVGMLDLKTMWPFPEETIKKICAGCLQCVCGEMNRGQMVGEAAKILRKANVLPILRKRHENNNTR